MSEMNKEVMRVIDSYTSAVFAKDSEALARLYDPGARVFDTWGIWSYDGASAWRQATEGWFTSLGTERVKVTFSEVKVSGSAELTSASAMVKYSAVSPDGTELRAMTNRLTWVMRTSSHVLRIIHEHTSAPIGFEDMKAILERKATP